LTPQKVVSFSTFHPWSFASISPITDSFCQPNPALLDQDRPGHREFGWWFYGIVAPYRDRSDTEHVESGEVFD
jgi:hypothetical protein